MRRRRKKELPLFESATGDLASDTAAFGGMLRLDDTASTALALVGVGAEICFKEKRTVFQYFALAWTADALLGRAAVRGVP